MCTLVLPPEVSVKGRYRDNRVHDVIARNAEIFMFDTVKFSLQQATKTQRMS